LSDAVAAESSIESDTTLADLGIDSLSVVEFRNKLSQTTGVALSNELILSNPSMGTIEDALLEELRTKKSLSELISGARDESPLDLFTNPDAISNCRRCNRTHIFVLSTPPEQDHHFFNCACMRIL
jgi:acyl carrier protein